MCLSVWVPREGRSWCQILWSWSNRRLWVPWSWEPNTGHLEEPHVLSAPEPALQPQINLFTFSAERVPELGCMLGKCFITQPSPEPCTGFNTPVLTCSNATDNQMFEIIIFTSRFFQETTLGITTLIYFIYPQSIITPRWDQGFQKQWRSLFKKKNRQEQKERRSHTHPRRIFNIPPGFLAFEKNFTFWCWEKKRW